MSNIVLVGTVHIDHKGPERLEKILQQYKPSIVCLEDTPKGATKGWKNHLDLVKKMGEIPWDKLYSPEQIERAKLELVSSFYESWVPKVYKNGSPNITLYCIDQQLPDGFDSLLKSNQRAWITRELANGRTIQDLASPIDMDIKDFVETGSVQEHQAHIDRQYDRTDNNEFISRFGEELFRVAVVFP